ncbi:TrkA family potassium uptake protein [Paenibacillus sp. N4]|uniref:potassium channel family protein n=1 Tax=Paenibacillus vietnamensis TaxID=2590547 RepID=UPI001CD14E15|nr:TrkA family potassium uptake protein [Paenibacillus vietnamensis]MCA0753741.1 TrkA family potassium uptake protein [Paenibacillus vietnamensis]
MRKKQQYAVIGLGRFGSSVANELINLGYEVLGIDRNEKIIEEAGERLTHSIIGDTTDEEVLKAIGIRNFDCVIVAIGDDIEASIMTTILLKDLGVPKVVAKALSELHGKVLHKMGVDRIIFPEREMGARVANQIVSPNLLDYIELSKDYTIAELSATKKIAGRSLKDLDTRARHGCSIVAINNKHDIVIAPTADSVIEEGNIMVVIGTNEQIDKFESVINN